MAVEREKKWLASSAFKTLATEVIPIRQYYFPLVAEKSEGMGVRIRISHKQAFITIKGPLFQEDGDPSALSRQEYEYEIPMRDAEDIVSQRTVGVVEKKRYMVPVGEYLYEVDEYIGANEGLITAELELPTTVPFPDVLPSFILEDITGHPAYTNASLAYQPYGSEAFYQAINAYNR